MAKNPDKHKRRHTPDEEPHGGHALRPGAPPPADLAGVRPMPPLIARLTGARACFGKPITAGGHTIVPVAAVRTVGGFGSGQAPAEDGEPERRGEGGGGYLDARPIGFIDVSPEGARFEPIRVPVARRLLGLASLLSVLAVARSLRGGRPAGRARAAGRARGRGKLAPARPALLSTLGPARLRRRRAASSPWPPRSLGR